VELEPCSVTEQTLRERAHGGEHTLAHFDSYYKDIRTVSIKTEPLNNGFIYIFEYSLMSAVGNESESETATSGNMVWVFAGASSLPQITFQLPDPCRDYQFRLLVVVRSTAPKKQLVVYRWVGTGSKRQKHHLRQSTSHLYMTL
jgi:hypothetical protein